jgi:cytoskeletal protein CcmA (bactofilin family)
LSFFKKKRFSEVEGYERISRLIEDRQRGVTGDGNEGDLEEDTVLLTPQVRPPRESAGESVSLIRPSEAQDMVAPETTPSFSRPEPTTPTQPPTPAPAATPRMKLPELPGLSGGASLVSKDAVWEGKLSATGDVRIEGTLQGEIESSGTLFVAEGARVLGQVRARSVLLAGEIDGQLRCDERLEVLPGGSARGEIDTGTLVVHEGAYIESKFQMRQGAAPALRG